MKQVCIFKPKKKINYNRANLKRIRNFKSKLPIEQAMRVPSADLSLSFFPIPKFLDPVGVYRLPGDLIIEDKCGVQRGYQALKGSLTDYQKFKKVLSITYDVKTEMLNVALVNFSNELSPSDLLISRLRTLGSEIAKKLSDFIENLMSQAHFKPNFKDFTPVPLQKDKYRLFLKRKQELLCNLNREGRIFLISDFNVNQQNGTTQLHRISFSKELINVTFDSLDEAMQYFCKQGFPDYLSFYDDYYEQYLHILQNIFAGKNEKMFAYLITKSNDKIFCRIELVNDFYLEENFMEGYLFNIVSPIEKFMAAKNVNFQACDESRKLYLEQNLPNCKKNANTEAMGDEAKRRCKFREIN